MRRWVLIVAPLAAVAATAWGLRGIGYTARAEPRNWERRLMQGARRWGTPPDVRRAVNPVANTDDVLRAGREHWADHCATCHANDGRGTAMGRSLYPPAPDMRQAGTQTQTDGELFYAIERGIPLTGMPAWGTGTPEGEAQSWSLVRFIRTLPRLTDDELAVMEALNPKSAAEVERRRAMQEFLNGR